MTRSVAKKELHGPGMIALLGSGETSASGGQVFEALARHLPVPLQVRVLETPAGFELNAGQVAGRVTDYLRQRLQNSSPNLVQVEARRKDAATLAEPGANRGLFDAELIFLGPGSPSYAVRHLRGSLTWELALARHRAGAALVLASAAAIAAGALALPVYEIFKVGEDPHWKAGLDLFAPFGLSLVIVSHWNNHDGGADLDTSRCFVGRQRFDPLLAQLPPAMTVLGLDEQTGVIMDLQRERCKVLGHGQIHILRGGSEQAYTHGADFSIHELGDFRLPQPLESGISPEIWQAVQARPTTPAASGLPQDVVDLLAQRLAARERRDWAASDCFRAEIARRGFRVTDTPDGQQVEAEEPIRRG